MKQFSKDLGNVSLAPKGKWSREQEYERLALVYNACDNLSYVAKINVPSGVDIENREYWQPMNATGYADNNFINLTAENENGTITAYETLEEAVATILPINRRAGATLSFFNLNSDRLDRQAEFELWQFNSTDLANWENKDYWNNIYYNWNVFAGWYIGADALKNHVKIPNVGQYAYVGSNLNNAVLYQCRTNGTWTNTGTKVRNYISVVVEGNITIGDNGNWFSNGKDTGIPATPAVDEQLDNIIIQLQQHATEIDKLQKQDVALKSNIDSNFETINNKVDEIKTTTDNKIDAADVNLQNQITSNDTDIATLNTKHESLSRTVQGIAATGGASTANNVTYNNDVSGLNAENAQDAIDELVKSLKDEFSYKGIAQSTTNPGVPDGNVFYIAGEGSYPNFNNQVVEVGQIAVLKWDGSWHKEVLEIGAGGGNMILDWNTDIATTRKQVLQKYRKPGIQISYNDPNRGWINEQYVYNETSDTFWVRDENWDTVVNTTYMAEAMYIPLKWNIDVRQTRIQIPIKLRKKGIKLYYKKQLPTIVYMSVGGYPQVNKGGSFNVEIDNKITKIQTQTSDNTATKIAELIVSTVVSENWDITNNNSTVIFTSKEIGNRTDYPFAYGNMDGCYFNFTTRIQQFGYNDYVYEEYIGTETDNNTFGNINTNWIELSAKEESIIYETSYKYNPLLTRMYIPINFRKNGKVIRYTDENGKVLEETYIGSGTENIDWCNSINWKRSNGKIGYIGNCDFLFSFTKTDWWETSDYQTYTPIELPTEIGTALSTDYLEIDKLGSRVLLFNSNYYQLDLIIFDEEKNIIPTKMNIGGNSFFKNFSCVFLPLNAKYVRVRRNIGFLEETEINKQYQLKTLYEGDDTLLGQHDIDLNKLGYCRERKMLPNGIPENIINSGILTVSTNLFPINNKLKYFIYGVLPNSSNNTPILCFYDKQYKCIETIIIPYTTINTHTESMYGFVTPPDNAAYGIASWHDVYGSDGGTILRVIGQTEILNEYLPILYNTKIQIAETLDYKSLGDSISAESGSYTRTVAEKLHSRSVEYCAVGGAGFASNKNGIYWIGKQLDNIPQGYEGIITLMGGINDWGGKVPLGSTEEAIRKTMDECYNSNTLMDNFRWVLETMINKCSWKARIFILTQLERYPIVDAGYTIENMRVETEKLAAHYLLPIIDVGRKCGLRNGDNLEEDWRRVDGNVKVHPTLDGHNIIGSYVAAKIISMLNGGIKVYKKDE